MSEDMERTLIHPTDKVVLIYQAVIELINENVDINTMKVVDITARAGIGKGTAYEYFKTKEEIITKALIYDVLESFDAIRKIAESDISFKEKVMAVLDLITENFHANRTFCILFKIGMGAYDISEALHKEYMRCYPFVNTDMMFELNDKIMMTGKNEGTIYFTDIHYSRITLNTQMVGYSMFLLSKSEEMKNAIKIEEAKEFVYQSIIKILN